MSTHVFGVVVTGYGTAANNRGDNDGGNTTTLQKILWKGDVHSTVSAEAIRWALRFYWQRKAELGEPRLTTSRRWDEFKQDNVLAPDAWAGWLGEAVDAAKTFIDDDVLGFMLAEGAKAEGDETEADETEADGGEGAKTGKGAKTSKGAKTGKKGKKPKAKGTITRRRGVLEVTRAVSTTPYAGDITFNARSGEKGSTSLYSTEVHATRYQYGFALTPARLAVPWRVLPVLDAIAGLGEVAGNHSRFLYDFSPESLVLRITDDMAPRLLYCFDERDGVIDVPTLVARVEGGDVAASELILGGLVASSPGAQRLQALGATVLPGVLKATQEARTRLAARPDLAALLAEPRG
jgi:CRISPR-associated protein Cst2